MQRTQRVAARSFHLGKKAAVFDRRTLQFSRYLDAKKLSPPEGINWGKNVHHWPVYLNNRYADCTCAAAAHMIENWTAAVSAHKTLTDVQVLEFYKHFTNPGPENDCDVLSVLKYWRSNGLAGHKIVAFTQLQQRNVGEVKEAIAIFGGCYVGLQLPKFAAEARDPRTVPWVVPPQGPVGDDAPDQSLGHCVAAVGYDKKDLHVISWGTPKLMTWGFYQAYADENYAILSEDFLSRNKSPSGFDMDQLKMDLAKVGNEAR